MNAHKASVVAVVAAALCVSRTPAQEQDAGAFFRFVSPTTSVFTAVESGGTVTWSNAAAGVSGLFQCAAARTNLVYWYDYVQYPVTGTVMSARLFDPHPPAGMVLIPEGSFQMGDPLGDGATNELPVHTVYVSGFYLDTHEVTKTLWDNVKNWSATNGYTYENPGAAKAANHPVHTINWYDAVKWCNARSENEGRTPAYCTDAGQTRVYRDGWVAPYVNESANGYRLPTEAQWEKAARGGARGRRFPWRDADTIQHARANYRSSDTYAYDTSPTRGWHPLYNDGFFPTTSPVGSFAPNGYRLYDMAGNMWEWCWDWHDDTYYESSPASDPTGPDAGSNRSHRGGSCHTYANYARAAYRGNNPPDRSYLNVGFRTALPAGR